MTASLPRLYCHNTMTAPIGLSVKRREDRRLLTGRGHYVDDVRLPHLCHAAIVRSPHAHARILDVDARRATALPGVVAVLTIADLPECAAAVPSLVTSPRFRPYVLPRRRGGGRGGRGRRLSRRRRRRGVGRSVRGAAGGWRLPGPAPRGGRAGLSPKDP